MKESIFNKIFIPFYDYIYKQSNRTVCYKKLKCRDFFSREDLHFIQWKKLKKLVNHCYYKISYYRQLFKSLDIHPADIQTAKDYGKIPEFNLLSLIDNQSELLSPGYKEKNLIIDYTSRTTGIPAKIFRSHQEQKYIYALNARGNSWCGWNYRDKTYRLVLDRDYIKQADSLTGKFSSFLPESNLANTKNISRDRMYSWVKQIRRFKPSYLYGYSSLLEEFSIFIINENITLKGIKGVFSTAEPLIKRELIANAFKSPVYDEYYLSEVPCIAHECKYGKMHLNIDEIMVEAAENCGSYETGELICTPLYLYGMPILRYNTGNAAVINSEEICECGLPYPTVTLKAARMNDNLISSNGKLVSGLVLSSYISAITKGIRRFQIVQKDLYNIKVKISAPDYPNQENEQNIRKLFFELMETTSIKINFEYYDKIPPDINGNFRPIISNIGNNDNYKANIRAKTGHIYQ